MKHLTLSLVLSIITATLGLGWLLSQVYSHLDERHTPAPALVAMEALSRELAVFLDNNQGLPGTETVFEQLALIDADHFPIPDSIASNFYQGLPLTLQADNHIRVYAYLPKTHQVLQLEAGSSEVQGTPKLFELLLTLGFYGGIALVILLWLYPLIRQLTRLRRTAKAFGEGNLTARLAPSSRSYIADIEQEFNAMAERIATLINDNKLLSRAVSHDLKTPLARLHFGVETLAETESPELRKIYAQRLQHTLDGMDQLIQTLLTFARLDQANIEFHWQVLDLNPVVSELLAQRQDERLGFHPSTEAAFIRADKRYLSMLINNLLDNAVRFRRQQLSLVVINDGNTQQLVVADDGPGFAAEDSPERLLQPFQRGSHADEGGGHGMGLAICHKITQWFNARLILGSSQSLGGAEVRVVFPTAETTLVKQP